jgi:hypothetical protein
MKQESRIRSPLFTYFAMNALSIAEGAKIDCNRSRVHFPVHFQLLMPSLRFEIFDKVCIGTGRRNKPTFVEIQI